MSANLKNLAELSKRGPHRVMEGDLGYTGLPGKIYVPEKGNGIPGVAFGHDWMKNVGDYHATLRHLASWGIAVAAPDTEKGFRPNHAGFAADLESALQILAGVKLGNGNVTVSPGKLGIAGHGMGGGAAVLASVDNDKVNAIAAVYPADVAPSAVTAARSLYIPGMIIGPDKDANAIFDPGNPAKLAYNWAGPVVYRSIKKGNQQALSEDNLKKLLVGVGRSKRAVQETTRGLLTGFFLHQLEGTGKYSSFSEMDASGNGVQSITGTDLAEAAGLHREQKSGLF
ncbi:dienelactone hydrolase family protein [Corynebacterium aquatimens]|uniref:Dienelactone hydrolase n=1 Tax=Corynebacterium aquatimens TaxID=1190508 RepID=A0A931E3P7_9CORY|nr:dienelactone hydrolase family protein [Corynebacterium aquatimens]MBG6123055.1 dienelactone hydrolase [Corynebacterium aquatimens]WJY66611.1 Alpha/beta hydrolase family protein [Corynebacterium aquatimens]